MDGFGGLARLAFIRVMCLMARRLDAVSGPDYGAGSQIATHPR